MSLKRISGWRKKERESGGKCRRDGMAVNRQVIAGRTGELMLPCGAPGDGLTAVVDSDIREHLELLHQNICRRTKVPSKYELVCCRRSCLILSYSLFSVHVMSGDVKTSRSRSG